MIGHTHIVAITGGIGSGKSVVSRILRCMGYPVYDCDSEARRLMDGSAEILSRIAGEISPDAIGADGRLRRDVLSAMVFSDSSKLQCLNSIVHGAVRKHLLSTVASCGSPLFFFETAILYESGFDSIADDVWEVTAPKCERVARVKSRSGLSADEIDRRMASQKTPSFPHHRIIHNSSTDALLPQILALTNEQR